MRLIAVKRKSIPSLDILAAHEKAAMEIGELRRKGVPCHLEDHADAAGPHVDVVREDPGGSRLSQEERGAQESSR